MKIVRNSGIDRVIDIIRPYLLPHHQLDMITPSFSLFAYAELISEISQLEKVQLILPPEGFDLGLMGNETDRAARNRLQTRWIAQRCAHWFQKVECRKANKAIPQSTVVLRNKEKHPQKTILGSFSFSTNGLGITPNNALSLIQASERDDESQ